MDDPGGEAEREVEALRREFDQYVQDRVRQLMAAEVQRTAQMAAKAEADRLRVELATLKEQVAELRAAVRGLAARAPRSVEVRGRGLQPAGWRERLGDAWPQGHAATLLAGVAVVAVLLLTLAALMATGIVPTPWGARPAQTVDADSFTGADETANLEQGLSRLRQDVGLVQQLCGQAPVCDFETVWEQASPAQQQELFNRALNRLEARCTLPAPRPADLATRLAEAGTCLGALPPSAEPGQEQARARWVIAQLGAGP